MEAGLQTRLAAHMTLADTYRDDLAFIHDVGHDALAHDAAIRLLTELRATRLRGTIVDLGCGTGALAADVAEAGYEVLGIDVSPAMIERARARAPNAAFHVGSFVSAALPSCVAVAAIGEVLNYTFDSANEDAARMRLFRCAFEALAPGGVLLFDVAGPERAPAGGNQRTFATGPDWAVLVESSVDEASRMLTRDICTFRKIGELYRRDAEVHRLVLLDPAAILATLQSIGFEAEMLPAYARLALPRGLTGFLARKP